MVLAVLGDSNTMGFQGVSKMPTELEEVELGIL